ncbi:phage holin family protein [Rhodohalobacter sp. 614A]|uniref:phage holin family protein n=1 Tax=Rhodohalobacter sp. 614A TaxID=2908649 RepID=UPI001F3AE2D4|nr:phage holin family protein [Rhodohalobacter sp. 614A]
MSEQFTNNGKKSKITSDIREYVEKRVQLLTLTITEQVARIMAESFQKVLGMFILSFALFFLWFAVGFLIAELIGSFSAGFAIASLPLFVVGFIFLKSKSKSITEKVQAQLMASILDDIDFEKEAKQDKLEGKKIGQK